MSSQQAYQNRSHDGNSQLCFFAAAALFVAGIGGHIVNFFAPDSTNLDALLLVSLFYFGLAIVDLRITARVRARHSVEAADEGQARPSYNRAA